MRKTILEAIRSLSEVREMVELEILPEKDYPLLTFREEPEIIGQVLRDLKECL